MWLTTKQQGSLETVKQLVQDEWVKDTVDIAMNNMEDRAQEEGRGCHEGTPSRDWDMNAYLFKYLVIPKEMGSREYQGT